MKIMKNKNLLLFLSYLLVIVLIIFFDVILLPMMCGEKWYDFFVNFFAKIFNLQMLISLIAIGVGACMLSKKARAWSVRFLTVFLSLTVLDLFLRTGTIMTTFFACFALPNSRPKTFCIIKSIFYFLSLVQYIVVFILTKPWEKYILGFKSISAIENELDLEQVNQEIKEFEK